MRHSRLIALSALYLATHVALAEDSTQPAVEDATSTSNVMAAVQAATGKR